MSAADITIAPWLVRAYAEARRGRHLLLHGNIDDLVLWDGGYVAFRDGVAALLRQLGYRRAAFYNPVDGFTYEGESGWLRHRAGSTGGDGDGAGEQARRAPPPADPDSERQRRAAESRAELLDSAERSRVAEPVDEAQSLAAIRGVLRAGDEPTAVVVEFAELLVGAASDYLVTLRQAMLEAPEGDIGEPRRGLLVLVVKSLAALPGWLHEANPLLSSVTVETPAYAERERFLLDHRDRFASAGDLAEPEAARQAGVLANLTDGMTIRDLLALAATSQLSETPFSSAKELLLRHKVGRRDDPWDRLGHAKVLNAEQALAARVIGQDDAVAAVARMLVNATVGLDFVADADSASTRPKGVFFFVGPTGVGKTELAKALAEFVFDDENALRRFDMSEYSEGHAGERLTGAPPGYVGYDAGGALTNWIQQNPFSVVLFDEIEKAHRTIFDKFLQIIDDGRLTDGKGRTAYFSQAVVIFTSNLGAAELGERLRRGVPDTLRYEEIAELFTGAVTEFFTGELRRPEFLGRLGSGVVVFDMLRQDVVAEIAAKFLDQLHAAAAKRGLELVYDRPAILDHVAAEMRRRGTELGARQIRDPILEEGLRAPLNRWIMEHAPEPGARILVHGGPNGAGLEIAAFPGD